MNFQRLLLGIQAFWADRGCVLQQPYDIEVGAGTMHPDTFLRVLGPEPWRVAYCQPSRRPGDGRYGENPMRVYKHFQFQVILKPSPLDVQDLYLDSLRAFGIDPLEHDIRFEEDNWESPTLGAAGVGWQVVMDGMEISQFTYFQQAGGRELAPISVELTYGIERICMFLNDIKNIFDIPWNDAGDHLRRRPTREEVEHSIYSFREADVAFFRTQFEAWEARSGAPVTSTRPSSSRRTKASCKCSHLFNVLDARGALSVTERAAFIQRIRRLACRVRRCPRRAARGAGVPPASVRRHDERTAPSRDRLRGDSGADDRRGGRGLRNRALIAAILDQAGLAHGAAARAWGGTRRLAVAIDGVAGARRSATRTRVSGPPASAAFGDDGTPTPAGAGFAKKQGIDPSALDAHRDRKGRLRRVPAQPCPSTIARSRCWRRRSRRPSRR